MGPQRVRRQAERRSAVERRGGGSRRARYHGAIARLDLGPPAEAAVGAEVHPRGEAAGDTEHVARAALHGQVEAVAAAALGVAAFVDPEVVDVDSRFEEQPAEIGHIGHAGPA